VFIPAAPGTPNAPVIDEVGRNFVKMSWSSPMDDGGAKVAGYNVDARQGASEWVMGP